MIYMIFFFFLSFSSLFSCFHPLFVHFNFDLKCQRLGFRLFIFWCGSTFGVDCFEIYQTSHLFSGGIIWIIKHGTHLRWGKVSLRWLKERTLNRIGWKNWPSPKMRVTIDSDDDRMEHSMRNANAEQINHIYHMKRNPISKRFLTCLNNNRAFKFICMHAMRQFLRNFTLHCGPMNSSVHTIAFKRKTHTENEITSKTLHTKCTYR